MNEDNHELFEAELHKLRPAKPPEDFVARLMPVQIESCAGHESKIAGHQASFGERWLRWIIPAAATAAAALVVWGSLRAMQTPRSAPVAAVQGRALEADDVQIDRQLVASFDAVARMPDGQPVRFRCREWNDGVVLRDSKQGIVVEQSTPRWEIVPVSSETY